MSVEPRQQFAALAAQEDAQIDLARGALLIGAEGRPEVDIEGSLARLDALADELRPGFEAQPDAAAALRLCEFLFREQGFAGNPEDYYEPQGSFLDQVLERRRGLPITLSIIWIEVARRLGVEARGVGFPGHFLVRAGTDPGLIVDPFHGHVATHDHCLRLLRGALGDQAELRSEHLSIAGPRQILVRILSNLKRLYSEREAWSAALACVDRILLLVPDAPLELRDRGLLYARLECYRAAVADLERFAELAGGARQSAAFLEALETLRGRARQLH
jgi:regulator of sirC expression with transglutaminase-like and TPR domain